MTTESNKKDTMTALEAAEAEVRKNHGSSGDSIIELVRTGCLARDKEDAELRAELHKGFNALMSEQSSIYSEGLALKVDKTEHDKFKRQVSQAALLLIDAGNDITNAETAADNGDANAEALADKATRSVQAAQTKVHDCSESLKELEGRVKVLEDWKRDKADPLLDRLAKEYADADAATHSTDQEHEEKLEAPASNTDTKSMTLVNLVNADAATSSRRHYNPLDWTIWEWIVALIVGIIAWITLGAWAAHVTVSRMHEWTWIWYPLFGFFGFTLGGLITSLIREEVSKRSD